MTVWPFNGIKFIFIWLVNWWRFSFRWIVAISPSSPSSSHVTTITFLNAFNVVESFVWYIREFMINYLGLGGLHGYYCFCSYSCSSCSVPLHRCDCYPGRCGRPLHFTSVACQRVPLVYKCMYVMGLVGEICCWFMPLVAEGSFYVTLFMRKTFISQRYQQLLSPVAGVWIIITALMSCNRIVRFRSACLLLLILLANGCPFVKGKSSLPLRTCVVFAPWF